jgi:hypothetical protein
MQRAALPWPAAHSLPIHLRVPIDPHTCTPFTPSLPILPCFPAGYEVADALTLAELPESPTAAGLEGSPGPGFAAPGSAEKAGGSASAGAEGGAEAQEEEEEAAREALAWLPATLASLGLRLQALDASLLYISGQPAAREQLEVREVMMRHFAGRRPHAAAAAPLCMAVCLLSCQFCSVQHNDRQTRPVLPPQGYQFIQRPTAAGVVCGQPLGETPTPLPQPALRVAGSGDGGGIVPSRPAPPHPVYTTPPTLPFCSGPTLLQAWAGASSRRCSPPCQRGCSMGPPQISPSPLLSSKLMSPQAAMPWWPPPRGAAGGGAAAGAAAGEKSMAGVGAEGFGLGCCCCCCCRAVCAPNHAPCASWPAV